MPAPGPTANPQRHKISEVILMKMRDEHLVHPVVRDLERTEVRRRLGTDIEDELVAVPQLNKDRRRGLALAGIRHAAAKNHYPHLIRPQALRVREVPGMVGPRFDR